MSKNKGNKDKVSKNIISNKMSTSTGNDISALSTEVALASTTISPYSINQGSFAVDSNGQATYNIPIGVPPGINGATPSISLQYAHQSRNGICGVGWHLTGLSTITRVPATVAQDGFTGGINYDANDRYSLDGNRLMNMSGNYGAGGTVYYCENNNWNKIVAGSSPTSGFTVYSKTGQILTYGTTADSCILSTSGGAVRCWALKTVTDLNGNVITYNYTKSPIGGLDSTENYYISSITYNKSTISFTYTLRPDVMATYLGGYKITTSCILTSIATSIQSSPTVSTPINTYTLNYTTSSATKLSRITSMTISDNSSNITPPITFNWSDVTTPSLDTTQSTSTLLNSSTVIETMHIDTTGNGLTDIVQICNDPTSGLIVETFLASLNRSTGQISYSNSSSSLSGGYHAPAPNIIGHYPKGYQILSGDVCGRGLTDLIVVYPNTFTLSIDVFLSNGDGTFASTPVTLNTPDPWQGINSIGFYTLTANGDGRIDLVQAYIDGSSGAKLLSFNTYLSNFAVTGGVASGNFNTAINTSTQYVAPTTNKNLLAMDVNGDGMVDMVLLWTDQNDSVNATSFVTTYNGTSTLSPFSVTKDSNLGFSAVNQVALFPSDTNGDGILDLIQVWRDSSGQLAITSIFSDAKGGFTTGPTTAFNTLFDPSNLYPLGVNGWSQTCLLNCWKDANNIWNSSIYCSSSNGTFYTFSSQNLGVSSDEPNFFVSDLNGSGKAGLFFQSLDQNKNVLVHPMPSLGAYPDLINTITDMIGAKTEITYSPLTDSNIYTQTVQEYSNGPAIRTISHLAPDTSSQSTILGIAIYVVSSYTVTNNSNINAFVCNVSKRMTYYDAIIDQNGRGWQGFYQITTLDLLTGLQAVNTYNQTFPYTGTVFQTAIEANGHYSTDPKVPSGSTVLMQLTVNTFQSSAISGIGSATSYAVTQTGTLNYTYNRVE